MSSQEKPFGALTNVGRAPAAGLPTNDPVPSEAERRDQLEREIRELEGMLKYMGARHPQRDEVRRRLQELRLLLEAADQAP